ncbi:MAG TPA: glutamate-5-semialdehyde dehydrogenase, partial [Agromyces sp.]
MTDVRTDPAIDLEGHLATVLDERLGAAKEASRRLARATTAEKDAALQAIADRLRARVGDIVAANAADLDAGRTAGLSTGLLDRLTLDERRIGAIADAVLDVVGLTDPVGETVSGRTLPNGVRIEQVRVPLGVVGAIYEARPNVTVDIAALALKSGNAVALRGGSAAERTNAVLVEVLREAIASAGLPGESVQTVDDFGREGARHLMRARDFVDVLIPRGSAALIRAVVDEATVPVIETGAGVVHMFLDASAREDWAVELVENAKVQRPSVCNALETLLVHRDAAERLLPPVLARLEASGVTVHADDRVRALHPAALPVTDEDWATEHMSLDISVGVVDSLDEALDHIRRYSTKHTES